MYALWLDILIAVSTIFLACQGLLRLSALGLAWWRCMGRRYAPPHSSLVPQAQIPATLQPIFDEAGASLRALGFRYSHAECLQAEQTYFFHVFIHHGASTHAAVGPSLLPGWISPFDVAFVTIAGHGQTVITTDCVEDYLLPPRGARLYDAYCGSLVQQWQAHQQHVRDLRTQHGLLPGTPESYIAYRQQFHRLGMAHWCRPAPPDTRSGVRRWRHGPWRALQLAWRGVAGNKKRTAILRAHKGGVGTGRAAQVLADMAAFERRRQEERTVAWSWSAKSALFLSSSLLFVLSLGVALHWRTAFMLFAILLLHELGHWCGMRLCGYHQPQILFLPFLGGATLGYKDVATPRQKLLVHFLGPVPGLICGFAAVALAASSGSALWQEAGTLAIVINYCNLLPFAPLDGGNIVNTLFLKRYPRLGVMLLVVALACAGRELWWHGQSLLGLATVPFGLTLLAQGHWRSAAVRLARVLPPCADTSTCVAAICQTLAHPQFRRQATEKWLQLAGDLLSYGTTPPLTRRAILVSSVLYGAVLVLPMHLGTLYQPLRWSFADGFAALHLSLVW